MNTLYYINVYNKRKHDIGQWPPREKISVHIMSDGALDQHDKTKVFTQLKISCPVISCCSF